jgi:hypothetical protein
VTQNPYETRDSQQKAFARAEARAIANFEEHAFVTVQYTEEALRDFITDVNFEEAPRLKRSTWDAKRKVIRLGKDRSLATILHALAHSQTPEEFARHGPEFIQQLLYVIEYYAGGTVREIYERELKATKMLRFHPSHKPALAFLNYTSARHKKPYQVVLVWEDTQARARKIVGEFLGFTVDKAGNRVARIRQAGQVSERDIQVRRLRYAFYPRTT